MSLNIIKMISKFNFYKGTESRIKYIVIHYTGSTASAKSNCEYFAGGNRGSSAHYFVDHNGDIYQSVEDANSAWHCGSATYKHKYCRNTNSIGIELCCRTNGSTSKADSNWYFEDATVLSAVDLTKELMKKYNINPENVIRHYDVTGKICPAPYVFNTGKHTWDEFKKSISSQFQNKDEKKESQEYTEEDMWNDLKSAGFSDVVISAWLGNMKAESGLNPRNLQNTYEKKLNMTDESYTNAVDSNNYSKTDFINDKAGYGLCQWTYCSRKQKMYEYIVEKLKKSIGDPKSQLSFLLFELSTTYSGLVSKLKKSETVREASDLILTEFEKPANQSESVKKTREEYSLEYYKKYSTGDQDFTTSKPDFFNLKTPFVVKVMIPDLNIRKGPGINTSKIGKYTGIGNFTIVEVQKGTGSKSGWGLLKTYQSNKDGWISLDEVNYQS